MPLVSVIVPIYKVEQYLKQCLNSIVSQYGCDFELILVDDGSLDECPRICEEYAKEYSFIKVVHKQNGGLISARKAGLNLAQGEYVAFVDGDDFISENYFSELLPIAINFHPEVISFGFSSYNEKSCEINTNDYKPGEYKGISLDELKSHLLYDKTKNRLNLGNIAFSLCTKWIKREIIKEVYENLSNEIVMGEDLATTIPIMQNCSSIYISEFSGYYYRNNPNSIVNSFREKDAYYNELLYKHLTIRCGKSYYDRICAYACYATKIYISQAAKHFNKYSDFKKCLTSNFNDYLIELLKDAKIKNFGFKDRLLIRSCIMNKYMLLWILFKLKNG